MPRIVPVGKVAFTAAPDDDIVAYRVYFAQVAEDLAPDLFNYDDPHQVVEVVEGQTEYEVPFDTGVVVNEDDTFFFVVVSQDNAGNLSDPSPVATGTFDNTPPAPPTNVRFVA